MTADIAGKQIRIRHIPGPTGVRGRNSEFYDSRNLIGRLVKHFVKSGKDLFLD